MSFVVGQGVLEKIRFVDGEVPTYDRMQQKREREIREIVGII